MQTDMCNVCFMKYTILQSQRNVYTLVQEKQGDNGWVLSRGKTGAARRELWGAPRAQESHAPQHDASPVTSPICDKANY